MEFDKTFFCVFYLSSKHFEYVSNSEISYFLYIHNMYIIIHNMYIIIHNMCVIIHNMYVILYFFPLSRKDAKLRLLCSAKRMK